MDSPAVTNDSTTDPARPDAGEAESPRTALLVSETEAAAGLEEKLRAAGLSVARAAAREAFRAAKETEPSVVLLAFAGRGGEGALTTLARRLRADPATLGVPVVFLFREDGRALRSAALHLGADDYFAEDAPADEIRARLDSLFWRVEAARRSAPALAEQRDEIDNFIFLLDAVAADLAEGLAGTVALVEAAGGARPSRVLREARAFLKMNLRRADAVAFYGPTTLVTYLPRAGADAARATLARLREEFRAGRPGSDLLAGLAAFPADGAEVETLVERAEAVLGELRSAGGAGGPAWVRVYGEDPAPRPSHEAAGPAEETRLAASHGKTRREVAAEEARPAAAAEETRSRTAGVGAAARADEALTTRAGAAPAEAGRPAEADEAGGAPSPEEFRPRRSTLRRLMLVVSDAARMAQINLLVRSASYEVRAAFDGNHALNLLRIETPDVLLLDYELQGMSGAEMLRRLGQQAGAARLPPTVVLVPAGREDARREAAEAGARSVVELPYDPVMLLETLGGADGPEE